MIEGLENICNGIAGHTLLKLKEKSDFQLRTFYAETFCLSLLDMTSFLTAEAEDKLIAAFIKKDKSDPQFHFEFNNYALLDFDLRHKNKYQHLYRPFQFKGTPCTNWSLLRETVKIKSGESSDSKTVLQILQNRQCSSGLITDDPGVHSFQYHCFSTALLFELFEKTKDDQIKKSFIKAVNFIKSFILPNGDTLYIGRGQEQSFGYGSLVYLLIAHYKMTNDTQSLTEALKVVQFIKKFQKADGSFPLVMKDNDPVDNVDLQEEKFAGWYAYNNFYDYLCFLGYFMKKAELLLKKEKFPEDWSPYLNVGYRDNIYRKFSTVKYTAVWSRPGGYWSNDQTFPYICYKKKSQTPCTGGEQFVESLYSEDQLGFPDIDLHLTKWSWRKLGKGFWLGNILLWISPLGCWKKEIKIKDDHFIVYTRIWSFFKASDQLVLAYNTKQLDEKTLISNDLRITCDQPVVFRREGLCAKGKTKIYSIHNKQNTITVSMQ